MKGGNVKKRTKFKKDFLTQKTNAKRRGIEFQFSFNEWLNVWESSGKLKYRGRNHGKYCMARYNDCGPYAIGNVKIILHTENVIEGCLGKSRIFTTAHKSNLSKALVGRTLTKKHKEKIGKKMASRVLTKEHKEKISKSLINKTKSKETKKRMSMVKTGNKNPNSKFARAERASQ